MAKHTYIDEEEIKNYINETYNLELTKDIFIRPTKENFVEVVGRFLDDLRPSWRDHSNWKTKSGSTTEEFHEIHMMIEVFRHVKGLTKKMSTFDITIQDFLCPERKRSTIIFNYLIYLRAITEVAIETYNEYRSKYTERAEHIARLQEENEKYKGDIETIDLKLADVNFEQLDLRINKLRGEFEALQELSKDYIQQAHDDKKGVHELLERKTQLQNTIQKISDSKQRKQEFYELGNFAALLRIDSVDAVEKTQKISKRASQLFTKENNFEKQVREVYQILAARHETRVKQKIEGETLKKNVLQMKHKADLYQAENAKLKQEEIDEKLKLAAKVANYHKNMDESKLNYEKIEEELEAQQKAIIDATEATTAEIAEIASNRRKEKEKLIAKNENMNRIIEQYNDCCKRVEENHRKMDESILLFNQFINTTLKALN